MHEFSIAMGLLRLVEEQAKRAAAKRVNSIKVVVGKLTCVVPELLREAFDFCSQGTIAEGANLFIEQPPLLCKCKACEAEFEPKGFSLKCPECGEEKFDIISGRELLLERVEVEV